MTDPSAFDHRSRPELIEEARRHGIERPERMTRAEIKDEILRRTKSGLEQVEARGLFGVARSMLASVVESGLHLPDAARLIRGSETFDSQVRQVAPVATVTLAEIYAAQGHKKRALRMLEEVLEQEPDHEVALRVKRQLSEETEAKAKESAPTNELVPVTPDYVPVVAPEALVETTGEEIRTGQPPVVAEASQGDRVVFPPEEPKNPLEESSEEPKAPSDESAEAPSEESSEESSEEPNASGIFEAAKVSERPFREPKVALRQTTEGVLLYWELSADSLAHAGLEGPDGFPAVRIVGFVAQRGSPRREEAVVSLNSVFPKDNAGVVRLAQFSLGMPVRAAVGVELGDGFVPLAVARGLEEHERDDADFAGRARIALAS